jgi:hypothetical protein
MSLQRLDLLDRQRAQRVDTQQDSHRHISASVNMAHDHPPNLVARYNDGGHRVAVQCSAESGKTH